MKNNLRITLLLLLLATVMLMAACQQAEVSQTPVNTPVLAYERTGEQESMSPAQPTETPEAVVTPAPTEEFSMVPEDWYIDPKGNIPSSVRIIVIDNTRGHSGSWCITTDDNNNAVLQNWERNRLIEQHYIPNEILEGKYIWHVFSQDDILTFDVLMTEDKRGEFWQYYQVGDFSFCYKCTSFYGDNEKMLLATVDGYAVRFYYGNEFCEEVYVGPYLIVTNDAIYAKDNYCVDPQPFE